MPTFVSLITGLINDITAKFNATTPRLLPGGGTTGQALTKKSNSDNDAQWTTLGTAASTATGTSGHTVPFLDGTNTWANAQTFQAAITAANLSGTNTGDQTTVSGNAGSATKLATGHTLATTGDVAWTSPAFDGTANVAAAATLATTGVTAGSYGAQVGLTVPSLAIDAKGRVTSASSYALGTAATASTGTSGHAVPFLDATSTSWTGGATFGGVITASNISGTNTGDQTTVSGNAGSATKLSTVRTIASTGDVAWSTSFDGTGNATGTATLASVNSGPGTFGSAAGVPVITVDSKGRVTAIGTAALGTAATATLGTSGATVPLLSTANTWTAVQTFQAAISASNFSGSSIGTNTGDQTTVSGNAGSATKLATARTIAATGDVAFTGTFDGTANMSATATLAAVNSGPGTFGSTAGVPVITVDTKGRVLWRAMSLSRSSTALIPLMPSVRTR